MKGKDFTFQGPKIKGLSTVAGDDHLGINLSYYLRSVLSMMYLGQKEL